MFGRKHSGRRPANPILLFFRLILSLTIFAILAGGMYSAYKHFTGFDPLSLNPEAVARGLLQSKTPQDVLAALSSIKATEGIAKSINERFVPDQNIIPLDPNSVQSQSGVVLRFLMIADSHSDSFDLEKAISQAKQMYPDLAFLIGLGDYSEVGTRAELMEAKKSFDSSGLRYFLSPGDHDFWNSRDKGKSTDADFTSVFGPAYQSFSQDGFLFIVLNNADNYLGFSNQQLDWLDSEIAKTSQEGTRGIFVFMHEPLFHPSSDHFMGRVENSLKRQAKTMLVTLKQAGVKAIVSGDAHLFSQYIEPQTQISMITIGAVTVERNLQTPRFAVGEVMEDGSLRVIDIEIK